MAPTSPPTSTASPGCPSGTPPKRNAGNDRSDLLPLPLGTLNFDFEVLAITQQRGQRGIDKRDPVTLRSQDGQQILSIPDRQLGSRWYRVRLFRKQ